MSKETDPQNVQPPAPGSGQDAMSGPMLTATGKLTKEQINDGGADGTPYVKKGRGFSGPFGARDSD
jgi:hypothetical protein